MHATAITMVVILSGAKVRYMSIEISIAVL